MTITLDTEIAQDLIRTKLQVLDTKIQNILKRWKTQSIDDFLEGARDGSFEEAESDAIEIQNLLDKRRQIETLLSEL